MSLNRTPPSSLLVATVTGSERTRYDQSEPVAVRTSDETTSEGEIDVLVFPDVGELYRTFTPQTLELIDVIRREEPPSISETARLVDRDIKNVHTELQRFEALRVLSFVREGRAKRPVVEYDELRISVQFDDSSETGSESVRGHRFGECPEDVYSRITDAILEFDRAARVTYANETAEELLECPVEELVGSVIWEQFPDAIGTPFEDQYRRAVQTQEPVVYEEYFSPVDSWFLVRVYPSETGVTEYFIDITERKRYEQQLEYQRDQLAAINHLNRVIQEITHAAIDASSREEIERQVCDRLVETDSYVFAWIGEVERASDEVRPNCMAGDETSYLEESRLSIDRDDPHGRGPTGTAVRTRQPQFQHDIETDPTYEPWREQAMERGFDASAAIPILHNDVLYGVLNIYTARTNAFSKQERDSVAHLGAVIGHAVHAAEQRKALVSDSVIELEFRNEEIARRLTKEATPDTRGEDDTETLLSVERTVPIDDGRLFQFMTVFGLSEEQFTDSITRFPAVEDVALLDDGVDRGRGLLFRLTVVGPSLTETITAHGGRIRSVQTTVDETRVVADLPPATNPREVLDAVNDVYPETELVAQRSKVREARTALEITSELTDRLTNKQRAAVETAFFAGYFEWPRTVTGEEVAEMLGITGPTFNRHLRTAERTLLAMLFGDNEQLPE
ncbi:bacterio-opsin activator domain-containing protein [Natronorarus salvus]|uniref:bacterio-opsin activator domain-containing protein n=1 Tax=Natronorarus salvus TaxID=3117733 RepID=UPI002F26957A